MSFSNTYRLQQSPIVEGVKALTVTDFYQQLHRRGDQTIKLFVALKHIKVFVSFCILWRGKNSFYLSILADEGSFLLCWFLWLVPLLLPKSSNCISPVNYSLFTFAACFYSPILSVLLPVCELCLWKWCLLIFSPPTLFLLWCIIKSS